ncbi:MAG: universal stress protein [Flavobacteriales bacterium]|nr:universal stress protein [Flavobacteriales bacterium]
MKNLLIPTDFSANATVAAKYGVELFLPHLNSCTLINTYALPRAGASMLVSIEDILKEESVAGLKKEARKLKDWFGTEMDMELVSEKGDLFSSISRFERANKPELIVMGTKGADEIQDRVFGSNTWRVVENAKTPVLVVPQIAKTEKPKRIMLSTDLSGVEGAIIEPLIHILQLTGAHLDVVHISGTKSADGKDYFKGALNEVDHSFHTIFGSDGDVVKELTDFADSNDVDMIAMVHHHRGFFERIFTSSTTKGMALASRLPLLVLND